jgi:2-succinyl-5-enolpyruvyl-6-hydroxy-3-cyclohexene-1-carboxylate synthase
MVGDLALLHDLNSLALLKDTPYPVVVVAINNHGGGIFSFLPIARHSDVFEPYFGTPHQLSFSHSATMFGIEYSHAAGTSDLEQLYQKALQSPRSGLIEITTDREENVRLHRGIEEAAAKALA